MSDKKPHWSTGKFLLIALFANFLYMFTMNGVLNVWLDLGVTGPAMGAGSGVLMVFLLFRWNRMREDVKPQPPE